MADETTDRQAGALLDDEALTVALRRLPAWSGDRDAITRTAELPSFPRAIGVVDAVALVAERMDHHPDVDIRWRTLTFRCATHSARGVTGRDIELARAIDTAVAAG